MTSLLLYVEFGQGICNVGLNQSCLQDSFTFS